MSGKQLFGIIGDIFNISRKIGYHNSMFCTILSARVHNDTKKSRKVSVMDIEEIESD